MDVIAYHVINNNLHGLHSPGSRSLEPKTFKTFARNDCNEYSEMHF